MYRPRMPIRMRLTLRRPLATAAPARFRAARVPARVHRGPAGPRADTPPLALDRPRTAARVRFVGGTAASIRVTAGTGTEASAPAPPYVVPAPHPTHRVPKGGR